MSRPPLPVSQRGRRTLLALAILAILLLSLGTVPGAPSPAALPVAAPHPSVPIAARGAPAVAPAPPVVTGPFYHVTTDVAAQPTSSVYCSNSTTPLPPTDIQYCFPQAQNPSVLHLANGHIGLSFSLLTSHTNSSCPAAVNRTNSRVGFALSTDGGVSYGAPTYLGNSTCPYVSAIEPSFAVSNAGPIYGAFVEENFSNTSNAFEPGLPPDYGNRTNAALGFLSSTDNGTTFSAVRTLVSGGYIARPALATVGHSIYIVYTDTQNGTTPIGQAPSVNRPNPLPESVKFIASTDGGTTWSSPTTLPGENATESYTAFGASIAVSSAGTVAVAYATNRSCLTTFGSCSFYWAFGEDVVVVTSSNNGSTWSGPTTVGPPAAEAGCYGFDNMTPNVYVYPTPCLMYLFELTPQTSITFGASSSTIYVAWSGEHYPYYYFEENSNVNAAVSTDGGRSWNSTIVMDPALATMGTQEEYSTPAIAYSNGTVFLSFLEKNGTTCFISNYCSLLLGSYVEWATTSTDGLTWTTPVFLALQSSSEYTPRWIESFSGYTGSIGFNGAGKPVIAFALNERPSSASAVIGGVTHERFNFGTMLDVAVGNTGPTVTLTFRVHGNPALSPWNFSVDGVGYTPLVGSASYVVMKVPANQSVKIDGPAPIVIAYAKQLVYAVSVPELSEFSANATIYLNATTDYGLSFAYEPPQYPNFCMCLTLNGAYYIYIPLGLNFYIAQPQLPWYFPAGTRLLIQPQINQGSDPTLYYVGTGNGSATGPGTWANVTMNGPVNETVWNGLLGNSSLNVSESGLPTGTAYTFQVDGVTHSGVAGTPVYVSNLRVGPHEVTAAQANGSGGFGWFGTPNFADPVVPYQTTVTLTFAHVNLSSSLSTVAFHAIGILSGAGWTLSFNGTMYASTQPWINVTSRSGTFEFATFSAVTLGGQAGYAPTTHGPSITVTSGTTVDVNYTSAYEVRISAGVGGTSSSPLTQFVAPGSAVPLSATVQAGYSFLGWLGVGNGSYSGSLLQANITVSGPVTETALFAALPGARFNLTFTESGLPAGTWWGVDLNGFSSSTNASSLQIANLSSCSAGALGLYALSVPYAIDGANAGIRYAPSAVNGTICTTGTTVAPLQYSAEYLVNITANLAGVSTSATCGLSAGASVWCASGSTVSVSAPAVAGYTFSGWQGTGTGSYTGPLASLSLTPGGPVAEVAEYLPNAPPPTYTLTLTASPGLVSGTSWSVTVAGRSYSSAAATLVVAGLSNGTVPVVASVALSPDGGTRYTPVSASTSVRISGDTSSTVRFSVSFHGAIMGGAGGTVSPASAWFAANASVLLTASASAGYQFVSWVGTGAGYSGNDPNGTAVATAPFSEVATFAPIAAPATTSSTTTSIWSSPILWAALGLAGLAIGLIAGVVVSRRGKSGPPPGQEDAAYGTSPAAESAPPEAPVEGGEP
ncbi:MAG: glycoside hydrolase [Thermoplasmata archaeon]|nr:glycoside hydrolase [Thermoplasmata archaeon]MCI4357330.1 glycoside hydrolase [Thermoplasmata archaeon]